ncbi:hypothetical protein DEO72_LG3g219 [Vigna unguiculata]|uniref:Uncharacterized protein n=1 Tax=Vigna unguiculata TaxID=3917 RepID=A0A4D6LAZ4_VIGUN|nr:hypothetical protein DEO72_LG3g219 [Vigna unguiculata]
MSIRKKIRTGPPSPTLVPFLRRHSGAPDPSCFGASSSATAPQTHPAHGATPDPTTHQTSSRPPPSHTAPSTSSAHPSASRPYPDLRPWFCSQTPPPPTASEPPSPPPHKSSLSPLSLPPRTPRDQLGLKILRALERVEEFHRRGNRSGDHSVEGETAARIRG